MYTIDNIIKQLGNLSPVRREIIKHISHYWGSSYIMMGASLVKSFFAAKLLGPNIYGIWLGFNLLISYLPNLEIGILAGAHREIPILRGRNTTDNSNKIKAIKENTFFYLFLVMVTVFVVMFLLSFLLPLSGKSVLCLRFSCFIVALLFIENYCSIMLKADKRFDVIGRAQVIKGVFFLLTLPLIFKFGLIGFLTGHTVASFASAGYLFFKNPPIWRFKLRFGLLYNLAKIGLPIMMISFVFTLFTTFDRLVILKFLGPKQLGLYALGGTIAGFFFVAGMGTPVLYPRLTEEYGRTNDVTRLKRYITLPTEIISLVYPFLIGAVFLVIPFFVTNFLSAYIGGITAARIYIFSGVFLALEGMPCYLLAAINKQLLYLVILFLFTLLNLTLNCIFVKAGLGINGMACAALISSFLYGITILSVAMHYVKAGLKERLVLIFKAILPVAYLLCVLGVLSLIFSNDKFATLIVKELLFVLASSLLIYLAYGKVSKKEL